jgi:hypothetical protein
MLKIRDLGINVLPIPIGLPQVGTAGDMHIDPIAKYRQELAFGTDSCDCVTCVPCNKPKPTRKPKPKPKPSKKPAKKKPAKKGYRTAGFGYAAVAQLKRQLEEHIRYQQ